MRDRLQAHLPFLRWMRSYRRDDLGGDAAAGLTTAVMLIPQGMGYAMLAGLPPIIGLYASLVPLAVYALLGSSRQLAVGPVAMVSLLVVAGVGTIAEPGSVEFIAYALLLALLVGVLQLVMGVARLGFLVNFLSHPVVSGFTSAAALIIGFSQLGHLLGVDIARSSHVHTILGDALGRAGEIHVATLAIGVASIVALVALKRLWPVFPRALAVVAASSLLVWLAGLHGQGVAIVGQVPAGLPAFAVPVLELDAIRALLPVALTIALVGFMESISVAKHFARKHRYDVDANQELVGLGMANLAGSFFGAYPVTGGFSRTAVNDQAGSRTPMASLITAAVVGATLLMFTPLFYYLPKVVLAAIIMTAVFSLIDAREVVHLWRIKRSDLAMLLVTFAGTLVLGIEEGIVVGVGASLVAFVVRTTRPHVAVLGRLPGTEEYRNLARHPEAEPAPGVLAVRMDAQFYFGNVNFLKETLRDLEAAAGEPLRAVVIDASALNQVDASAIGALEEIHDDYRGRGIELHLANVKGPVSDVLDRAHMIDRLGRHRFHLRVHDAVTAARSRIDGVVVVGAAGGAGAVGPGSDGAVAAPVA
jgi:sulfate permease, SulP family